MEVKDYCKAMMAEVSAWKAKLEAMKKTADGTRSCGWSSSRTNALPTGRQSRMISTSFSARSVATSIVASRKCLHEKRYGRNKPGGE